METSGREQDGGDEESAVDRAGIEAVLAYEAAAGRVPKRQAHENPGFDVVSEYEDGEIARFIEVKSTAGPWDGLGRYRHFGSVFTSTPLTLMSRRRLAPRESG